MRRLTVTAVLLPLLAVVFPAIAAATRADLRSDDSLATPLVVVAAGDIACKPGRSTTPTACRDDDTARLLAGGDLVLGLGDQQYYAGSLSEFNSVYADSWGKYKFVTRPALGNHEYYSAGASGYFDYFGSPRAGQRGRGYYTFVRDGWRFIAINSNCGKVSCSIGSAQYKWLKSVLGTNPDCQVAYMHHPRWSVGNYSGYSATRDLVKLLDDYNVELLLTSHDHNYQRWVPQSHLGNPQSGGIVQFVVGTGGGSLYEFERNSSRVAAKTDKNFGVLRLTLDEGGWASQFVPVDGSYTDRSQGVCRPYEGRAIPCGPRVGWCYRLGLQRRARVDRLRRRDRHRRGDVGVPCHDHLHPLQQLHPFDG
jgi:hypothetical protein